MARRLTIRSKPIPGLLARIPGVRPALRQVAGIKLAEALEADGLALVSEGVFTEEWAGGKVRLALTVRVDWAPR